MTDTMSAGRQTAVVLGSVSPFDPPAWGRGQQALNLLAAGLSGALLYAIRERLLHVRHLPDWSKSRAAMTAAFGFDLRHHLFHADPVYWVRLTEPQATSAFVDFLNADDRAVREGRVRAFLRALGSDGGQPDAVLGEASAEAEADAGQQKRIDMLLRWQDASNLRRGAIVEAKFGHQISVGQLPQYRVHLLRGIERQYRKASESRERPLLFVVSSRRRRHDDKALARNRDWRWMSWRSLLLGYDRALAPEHDDDEFRRFRRTLWDRAGS